MRKSFNSLSNNKATGEDQIHAELLKYGTPLLDQTIAVIIFNATFSKHENLNINTGVFIAIQKPGKKKGPPNSLRLITLLNSLRKALSIITLNRIRPFVEEYLSKSQKWVPPRQEYGRCCLDPQMVGRKNTERRCQHQNIRDRYDRGV